MWKGMGSLGIDSWKGDETWIHFLCSRDRNCALEIRKFWVNLNIRYVAVVVVLVAVVVVSGLPSG
jgi:hypothetical protein